MVVALNCCCRSGLNSCWFWVRLSLVVVWLNRGGRLGSAVVVVLFWLDCGCCRFYQVVVGFGRTVVVVWLVPVVVVAIKKDVVVVGGNVVVVVK